MRLDSVTKRNVGIAILALGLLSLTIYLIFLTVFQANSLLEESVLGPDSDLPRLGVAYAALQAFRYLNPPKGYRFSAFEYLAQTTKRAESQGME